MRDYLAQNSVRKCDLMGPVIFLDVRVLMKPESVSASNQNDGVEFDEDSCWAFQGLIERVHDASIVLILSCDRTEASLAQIQAAYSALGFGDRTIGKIFRLPTSTGCAKNHALDTACAVDDWLNLPKHRHMSSLVIMERCEGPIYHSRSIALRECEQLSRKHVEEADHILTNQKFFSCQLASIWY